MTLFKRTAGGEIAVLCGTANGLMRAGRKAICQVVFDGISTRYHGSIHDGVWNKRAKFFVNMGGTAGVNALVPKTS